MCGCDDEVDGEAPRELIDPEIVRKARFRELQLGGDPAPEEAWDIFAGKTGGSISWVHYQRVQACYSSTAELAKGLAHMKRQRLYPRRISCSPEAVLIIEGAQGR
jgi:hypothetical protein